MSHAGKGSSLNHIRYANYSYSTEMAPGEGCVANIGVDVDGADRCRQARKRKRQCGCRRKHVRRQARSLVTRQQMRLRGQSHAEVSAKCVRGRDEHLPLCP
jgi:hypothetical protein